MVWPLIIGAGLAAGGAAMAGGGRRPRQAGATAQEEERERQLRAALSGITGLESEIPSAFGISEEEIFKRQGLLRAGTARTRQDTLEAIQANAARMGVSGAPGFVGGQIARALEDIGMGETAQELSLQDALRGQRQQAFGAKLGIRQSIASLLAGAPIPQGREIQRSPTFGEQIGPALAGVGGSLFGLGAFQSAFGSPTAMTTPRFRGLHQQSQ